MGVAPTPVTVSATGTGNSADGKISRNAIDDLIAGMSSKLLIYLRAVKINPASGAFPDALGNTVTAVTTATKNTSDPNFNGHESITFNSGALNQYAMAAGGIGIGTPPIAMTNSFTVVAGIHAGSFAANGLFGDTAGTTNQALNGIYLQASGNLVVDIGGTGGAVTLSGTQPLLASGSTGIVWISYDAATNIVRAGCNSSAIQLTGTSIYTRNGANTSTVCYPFNYQNSGTPGNQSFNRWLLFNKAYLNGAVAADDAAFSNLISAYAAYI